MSGGMEDMYAEEFRNKLKKSLLERGSNHYKGLLPEPIEIIEKWGLDFNLGNALKYIARCNYKGEKISDLKKAIWYLEREITLTLEE